MEKAVSQGRIGICDNGRVLLPNNKVSLCDLHMGIFQVSKIIPQSTSDTISIIRPIGLGGSSGWAAFRVT